MYASERQSIAHRELLQAIDDAPTTIPCAETDPDLFFPDDETYVVDSSRTRVRLAKALCNSCPVIAQCRNYAVMYFEPDGIWGGTTPSDRQDIRRNLRVVRPPSMTNKSFPEFW